MRVAAFMMFKNERDLLLPWARYHSHIFGKENLFIYDNGSDDPKTISIREALRRDGFNIDISRASQDDFVEKGNIFGSKIRNLEESDLHDFFFPLDCDEFVGTVVNGEYDFRRDAILQTLETLRWERDVLMIKEALNNVPGKPAYFRIDRAQRKSFFAKGSFVHLDHGFHGGKSVSGHEKKANVIYAHFHYRPFAAMRQHASWKLSPFVDVSDIDALKNHTAHGKAGRHLTKYFFMDEKTYSDMLFREPLVYVPQIREGLEQAGTKIADF